jgi:hypothetical protein
MPAGCRAMSLYDFDGLRTVNGIAEVEGNYPSAGGLAELGAWFRDSEGNLLSLGQAVAPTEAQL